MLNNSNSVTNSVIKQYRSIDLLQMTDSVADSEITHDFQGMKTNKTYKYISSGSKRALDRLGGFVVTLPKDSQKGR